MTEPDRKPFVRETMEVSGPGVDLWKQPERNDDSPTDHDELMADKERRRRIAQQMLDEAKARNGAIENSRD